LSKSFVITILTSFCIESDQILNVTLNLNSALFWYQINWFVKEPFSRALRRFANRNNDFWSANNVNIDKHNIKQPKINAFLIILSSKYKFCLTA